MRIPALRDPRWAFAGLLTLYAIAGVTALGFNRSPSQILLVVGASLALDLLFARLLRRGELELPLSAYITGLSLSLLVNYAHGTWLPLVPVLLSIASKHLLTIGGRHVYNPSLFGLAVSLLVAGDVISPAPAYQWGGSLLVPLFFVASACAMFLLRVGRGWLVASFLAAYALQTALRAWVTRWHLPPETLFLGTLGSPPFYLFAFYMITDPRTSPSGRRAQIWTGVGLAAIDLWLHTQQSLYTFYYAAFLLASGRGLVSAIRAWRTSQAGASRRGSWRRAALVTVTLLTTAVLLRGGHGRESSAAEFTLREVAPVESGIDARLGTTLDEVDPRVAHIAKWILSVGSAVVAADVDLDGRVDLFLSAPVMQPDDRAVLYRNLGGFRFERVRLPALDSIVADPKSHGLIAGGLFADWDNDGDPDLVLPVAFGRCLLLANRMVEEGRPRFEEIAGAFDEHAISVAAQALDYDRDGRLDLFIAQVMAPELRDYALPTPLNIFDLPEPEWPGDRRMFHFMHESWWNARNGGANRLYRGEGALAFTPSPGPAETHWSLAVGTGDLDHDGWTDLYVANDFGPDDLYRNEDGRGFRAVRGHDTSSIGRDTYKGMNATLADLDRDGDLDIYVSNVHEPLQAEGSLLWINQSREGELRFRDEAATRGALNERRFGWGAAAGDLDNDGWIDLLQANGMVDDTPDRRYPDCPDYWYVNEKVMRAGPEIHAYADRWGDLRGRGIFGHEANRVYLNRGAGAKPQFVDAARALGWTERGCSRGIALVDLDDDGRLDVVVTHPFGRASIYRNEATTTQPLHWIGLTLVGDGRTTSRDAIGSRVSIDAGAAPLVAEVQAMNGFSAEGDRRLHFGLGAIGGPITVEVEWYGGTRERFELPSVDRYVVLTQGSGTSALVAGAAS